MNSKPTGRRVNQARRRLSKSRGMQFEALERREVFATITGNTAPGGFEALNSAALIYWLNPQSIAQTDNTQVAAWNNQGTAANNFTQASGPKQPVYLVNGLNGQPAVRFDGDKSGATGNPVVAPNADELVLTNSTTPKSVFIVNNVAATSPDGAGMFGLENGDVGIRRQGNGNWFNPGNANDFTFGGALYVNGTTGTNPAAPQGTTHLLSAFRSSNTAFGATSIGDYFQVGTNAPRSWAGLVGDVLAFNRTLTSAERVIVENSLAAKYGITLANDFYNGDAAGYLQNVFGIGASNEVNTTNNLALGKPAIQSSELGGYPASNGTNGNFGDFTHTADADSNAFWQVDLGSATAVDQVVLYNRTSCCGGRFSDLNVQVYDASNVLIYTSPVLNPGNTLGSPGSITVNPGVVGRYVRVARPSVNPASNESNILSLGEVQVFSLHTVAIGSAGSSGFGIEATGGTLANNEYVMAGYKSLTNALVTTDLAPGVSQRFERVWYVNKTGSVDATMAFDFSDAGLGAPAGNISSYRLLYSPNNNFESSESAFQALSLTPTVNGDTITFAVPNGTLLNGYYTLGIRETATTVYVDDAWTGFAPEAAIVDADQGTAAAEGAAFGYNAFSSVTAAINAVGTNGIIIVNDGTYAEGTVPNLTAGKTLRLTGSSNGALTSTITISSLDSAAGTTINLQANALRVGDNTGGNNLAGAITGSGTFTKLGTDQLQVGGANTSFTGTSFVNGGQVRMNHAQAFGSAASNTITINNGANILLWFSAATSTNTISNNWVLTGIATTPDGGGIKPAIYGDGGGGTYNTYVLAGTITLNATSNLGGNTANNLLVTGRITGPGGLVKGGQRGDEENTLTLANPDNNYTGLTSVVKGSLSLGTSNVLPDTTNVSIAAGKVLDLAEFSDTVNGISGSGTVTAVSPLKQFFFSTDFNSLIRTGKTYTHLLDFANDNAPAVVNGVTFTADGVEDGGTDTVTGPNWTLQLPPNIGKIGEGSGGTLPTQLDDLGMERLYRDFYYTADGGQATSTLTLTGLTPGVTYETRIYNRQWGTNPRVQNFTFNHGQAVLDTVTMDEDASAAPNFLSYRYTASSSTLVITVAAAATNASYHFYGMSNEVATAEPKLTVTGVSPVEAGTLLLAGGTLNVTGTTGGSVTVGSGATLTGTGTINGLATINNGGKIAPGTTVGAAGQLAATGGLASAGSYIADVGTPGDKINVTGAVNLTGSTLVFNRINLPHTPGTRFVLIDNDNAGNDAVVGTFAGLPEGTTITVSGDLYRITYNYNATTQTLGTGNDVALIRNDDFTVDDDSFTMLQNTVLNGSVADNDFDPDGDAQYSIPMGMGPTKGTVTLDPVTGDFVYTPNNNFMGTDTFTYRLADGEADFDQLAVVTIKVTNMYVDDTGTLLINGGAGNDRVVLSPATLGRISVRYNNAPSTWSNVTNKVVVFGQEGNDTISVAGNIGLPVEFYGGADNDYLAGGNFDDILDGGDGTDRLLGGAGNDQLYGGAGNDSLTGGVGNDLLDGDRSFEISPSNEVGDLLLPALALQGRDTLSGEIGNDVMIGWGGVDSIFGGAGNDLAIGGAALDTIRGSTGDDLLYGGDLNTDDAMTISALAQLWFDGDVDQVVTDLSGLAEDDFAANSLHGEAGADIYLLWLLDKIALPAEKKPPNVSYPLY